MIAPLDTNIPVLVTGASSGIGREFARAFARRGHDVTLVARRRPRLEALAAEIDRDHSVAATVLDADLEAPEGVERVAERLREGGRAWVLVNNAGFGDSGRFTTLDPARAAAQVAVNVLALQALTAAVLPGCAAHHEGGVINLGSTAAYQPVPYMATYAATKAFVLHFTEALAVEMSGTGVRVMALCPGAVRTEFAKVAGNEKYFEMALPMDAAQCVRVAVRAFERNRTICVPGVHNALMATSAHTAPRAIVRRVAGAVFKGRTGR